MKNIGDRVCRQCGKVFQGGPRAWYCPVCRKERERQRKWKYNNIGFDRHLGDIDVCKRCGKEYVVEGGLQRYCKECSREAIKEKDRLQSLEWYHKNKEEYNPKRYERRKKRNH